MPYFVDLSPYVYFSVRHQGPALVNVGWLSAEHRFTEGAVPSGLVERLTGWPTVMQTRGFQVCPFCGGASGSAELWVYGPEATYAAPSLLPHYIAVHGYRPPDGFIDAVMQSVDVGRLALLWAQEDGGD